MPLLLRGNIAADNYFPTKLSLPSQQIFDQVASSFDEDSDLQKTMQSIIMRPRDMLTVRFVDERQPMKLAKTAAEQLSQEDGPRIAVFDLNGFDTHAAQGGADSEHGEKLNQYDQILRVLKKGLGQVFEDTLILTLTEFGRKVEENGGMELNMVMGLPYLWLAACWKAQIYADWPGLEAKNLFEGQDLNATLDARAVMLSNVSLL